MSQQATTKNIECRTRMTGKVLALAVLPMFSSFALFYFAFDAGRKFAPADPARLLFAGLPLGVGCLIFFSTLAILAHFSGRIVEIKDGLLIYQDSRREFHVETARLAFTAPKGGLLKVLNLSDGENTFSLPAAFLDDREFAELLETLEADRRKARQARSQSSYSL